MAAAEESNHQPHPPPPAPSLPQYPVMILAAIEALNDKNGLSKSAITKFIESTHGDLPAAHSTLLSHHLNKMKLSGELIMVKNNYMKPDPNAPPRRGRGRPPKLKGPQPVSVGTSVGQSRPRGRPPKPRDPFAPPPPSKPKTISSGGGRPRGRPPKKPKVDDSAPTSVPAADRAPSSLITVEVAAVEVPASGAPRGRGRPPKVKTAVAAVGA